MNNINIPTWNKSVNVLLVEDNEINSELIYELLKLLNISVFVAYDGKEAVDLVYQYDYDIILMDIQMPVMNGIDATKILRSNGIKTPIIALTGGDDVQTYKDAGMNSFLQKPVLFDNLCDKFIEYLNEQSLYVENTIDTDDATDINFVINISMIDLSLAKLYFAINNPKKTFLKRLYNFKTIYHDFEPKFYDHLDHKEYDECLCLIYNLINYSGIIGSKKIFELSKVIQKQLSKKIDDSNTHKLISELMRLMSILMYELGQNLPFVIKDHSTKKDSKHNLQILKQMITEFDYSSYNFFEEVEDQLYQDFNTRQIRRLEDAINRFDFESAFDIIDEIL